jgi:hypothetical protein
MKKYTYNDWFSGKIRLDTCAAIFPKGLNPIQPISIDNFGEKDILKIRKEQKKIFKTQKDFYLKRFLDGFTKRHKSSKLKDVYLNRELTQCKMMLTTPVLHENSDKLYSFPYSDGSQMGKDLAQYYEYFKDHRINGNEMRYDFINSPNYKYQDESTKPRQIFAQALIEFFEFLNTLKKDREKSLQLKKIKQESYEKIFNSSFSYCKKFEKFQQDIQIDKKTLNQKELLIKLRDYKINYSIAVEHLTIYDKKVLNSLPYEKILNWINEEIEKLLKADDNIGDKKEGLKIKNKGNSKHLKIPAEAKPKFLEMFFYDNAKYIKIMALLVEKCFCVENTHFWYDKSNSNKSTIVSVLKYLHIQGYYINNKKLTAKELIEVAKNTFGATISESFIKKHDLNINEVKFIPSASNV